MGKLLYANELINRVHTEKQIKNQHPSLHEQMFSCKSNNQNPFDSFKEAKIFVPRKLMVSPYY